MRLRLRLLLALMSCCSFMYLNGCGPESESGIEIESAGPVDEATHARDDANPALTPTELAPTGAVTPPAVTQPPGPRPAGGGGGGGGSQGSEKRADTGNPDNDPRNAPETICNDGIDNDGDGAIDCLDSDCIGQSCNDGDGCTTGDTCSTARECVGTDVNCDTIIGNECAMNDCESISSDPGDNNFKCNSMLLTNAACTPADNCLVPRNPDGTCPTPSDLCILGHCVEEPGQNGAPPSFVCEGQDRAILPVADGGCFDGNPCHSFACEDGECDIDILDGVFCDDDNECTGMGLCNLGVCEADPLGACIDDDDCAGGECVGFVGATCTLSPLISCTVDGDCAPNICVAAISCSLTPNVSCTVDADCPPNTCGQATPGSCTCNDGDDCTVDEVCDGSGVCGGGSDGTQTCTVNEDCDSGACDTVAGLCLCSDGNSCTGEDACVEGSCVGTTVSDTCTIDADCANGGPCIGAVAGSCSNNPQLPCFTDLTCLPGICLNATFGACSCDDGIACTTNTCDEGACEVTTLVNESCVTDEDPCTTQECTATGCKTTIMDGEMPCEIGLTTLVSDELDTALTDAGLDGLDCTFGRLTCEEGDASACSLNETFPPTCTELTLEQSCTLGGVMQDIDSDLAADICAELNAQVQD